MLEATSLPPLILLEAARIETAGVTAEPLTARGGQRSVTLIGAFGPLLRLLCGESRLVGGRAELFGTPFQSAVAERVAGLALCDPPLVSDWTVERYLLESALLAGLRAHARAEVNAALTLLGLSGFARHRLGQLALPLRRIVLLAHATLGAPLVLCVEAPLADLDPQGAAEVAGALRRAAGGRGLITTVREPSANGPEHALVTGADWVLVERRGRIVAEGPPARALAAGHRFVVVVTRRSSELMAALAERGIRSASGPVTRLPVPDDAAPGAEPVEMVLELPSGGSANDIVLTAQRVGAPIVELLKA